MSNTPTQTALVTGATSGLGFEAAAQLGDAAYGRVIITGRTPERAREAADRLSERVGRNVFEAVALDLNDEFGALFAVDEWEDARDED